MHREGIAPDGAPADDDVAAQAAAWLELDLPGEIARMIEAAEFPERRKVGWGGNYIGVPYDEESASPLARLAGTPPPSWPIAQRVAKITPDQLRAIAANHEAAADALLDDADQLREYATALEDRTPLGVALLEHFGVMREEADHRAKVHEAEYEEASGDGGVLAWEAIDWSTRQYLYKAGLLTIDAVRAAVHAGELWNVAGIGKVRYRQIRDALTVEGAV